VHLDAVEHESGIVFMHSVKPGPANQSYGLQVAQLAGIPAAVIDSARDKLAQLEAESLATESTSQAVASATLNSVQKTSGSAPYQSELFVEEPHPVIEMLERINPDEITAKEALELLYALKAKLG
jgi:DNA mismatch repair protein MutS